MGKTFNFSSVSVSWPGPTPKVSDRRLQVDYGVLDWGFVFWYFRHVGKIPNSMGSNPSVSLEFFFFIPLESLITFGSTIQPTMEPDT